MTHLARLTLLTTLIAAPAWAQDDPEGEETAPAAEEATEEEATDEEATEEGSSGTLMSRPGGDEAPAVDEPEPEPQPEPQPEPEGEPDEAPADELPPMKEPKPPREKSAGGPFMDKPAFEKPNPTLRLWLYGAGGFVAEPTPPDTAPELDGRAGGGFSLGGSYGINDMLRVGADITERFYAVEYITTTPSFDGEGNQRIATRESLQDLQIVVWFDVLEVLPMDWLSRHLRAEISLAPRWFHLDSEIFRNSSGALRGGLDLVFYPAENLHFSAALGTSPRLFGRTDSVAIQGHPIWFNDYKAAIGLDLGESPRWEIEFGWRADTVVFERTSRTMHVGQVGLQFAL